jgi:hypothetical protein
MFEIYCTISLGMFEISNIPKDIVNKAQAPLALPPMYVQHEETIWEPNTN